MDNPEKTEGAIKNGQSRDTDNIGYTRHRTKTKKTQKKTQKTKNMSNMDPTKNRGSIQLLLKFLYIPFYSNQKCIDSRISISELVTFNIG